MKRALSYILVLTAAWATEAGAQEYVFPAMGQSPETRKADAACLEGKGYVVK